MGMYSCVLLGVLNSVTSNVDRVTMDVGGNGSTSRSEAPDMQEPGPLAEGPTVAFHLSLSRAKADTSLCDITTKLNNSNHPLSTA